MLSPGGDTLRTFPDLRMRALGDDALAAECDAQSAGLATRAVPFAIPASPGPAC